MKIGDWSKIQAEFDSLTKMMEKAKKLLVEHGGHPTFYIKLLCDLEDLVTASLKDKAGFKKLR